jgi:hypothetical protein
MAAFLKIVSDLCQKISKNFQYIFFLALNTNTFHHYMGDEALLSSIDTPSGLGRKGEKGGKEEKKICKTGATVLTITFLRRTVGRKC